MTHQISKDEYRRNLPHIQPQGAVFFVTFRLYNSIPVSKWEILKNNYLNTNTTDDTGKPIKQLKQSQQEDYFLELDELLDTNRKESYFLAIPDIAKLVYDSITYRDGKNFKLVCFCIMSNHVHMIIYNLTKPLHIILKELKSFTGKEALKILKQMDSEAPDRIAKRLLHLDNSSEQALRVPSVPAKFWQPESFDRIIRDKNDLAVKIKYTLNNPVKAGLVTNWNEWKWSFCRPEFLE